MGPTHESEAALPAEALQVLFENRRKFLQFLQKRVGSAAEAEDILQAAFVRSLEKGASVRDQSSVVAWFYQTLRNAVIDHYRRQSTRQRTLEEFVHELERNETPAEPTYEAICGCIGGLLETMKPEYRQAIRAVDMEDHSLAQLADAAGISEGNAGVRVHRAREALRKRVMTACGLCAQHGCVDCRCGSQPHA